MKIRSLLFALVAIVFVAVSCTNDTSNKKSEEVKLDTRGAQTEESSIHVTGTWKNDNTTINFKFDGSFEANFDENNTIIGKWSLSEDEKTLTLTEDSGIEGKGQSFNKTYTVLELSHTAMHVEDEEGNKLKLKSE